MPPKPLHSALRPSRSSSSTASSTASATASSSPSPSLRFRLADIVGAATCASARVHVSLTAGTCTSAWRSATQRAFSAAPPAISTSAPHRFMSSLRTLQGLWRFNGPASWGSSGACDSSSSDRDQCSFPSAHERSRGSPGDARQEDESRQRSVLTSSSAHGGRNGDSGTLVSEATDARSGRVPSAWGEIGTAPSARSAELTSAGQACLKATATRGERAPQKLAAAFRVSRASCAFRSNHALLPSPNGSDAFASTHQSPPAATTSTVAAEHFGGRTVLESATPSGAHAQTSSSHSRARRLFAAPARRDDVAPSRTTSFTSLSTRCTRREAPGTS
mmetsp:Transcript_14797/g.44217  ORF Transcript_14797/g.44217 Transcript_14797/m.44217 type:complete len:333 (-) Transcript_14797:134-1132(-)